MNVGLVISGLGHGALLVWAMLDLSPRPDPEMAVPEAVPVRLVAPEALEVAAPPVPVLPPAPVESAAPDPVAPPPPADRVALLPAPPPPERAVRSDLPQEAVRPDPVPLPEALPEPPQPAEAPPAAAERIAPEPEEPVVSDPQALLEAPRPGQRPDFSAIADALAEALEEPALDAPPASVPPAPTPVSPSGPPLTGSERDGLRLAVGRCWNFGALSTEAARVTVTVWMRMAPDGRPDANSLRLAGFEGGSETAAQQAYEVARRAILRCGGEGYPLPPEKYAQWQEIEMVFNPDRMRGR
ncbi:MAG: hypothetical protein AAGC86_11625 [Pseudomonadota bacterium]